MKSTRGAVPVIIWLILVAIGGALAPLAWHQHQQAKAPAKLAAAQDKDDAAKVPVLKGVQENTHKTDLAIDAAIAGNPRALSVAKQFSLLAMSGIDQLAGAPSVADDQQWRQRVRDLESDNASIRAAAEKQNTADTARIEDFSAKLATQNDALAKEQVKSNALAVENAATAAWVHKWEWIIGIVAGLYVASQLLSKAAEYEPALAPVAAIVNRVASPLIQDTLENAKSDIQDLKQGVGTALGYIKAKLPDQAAAVVSHFDAAISDPAVKLSIGTTADATAANLKT